MVGDAKFSEAQDFSSLKLWSGFFLGGGKLFCYFDCCLCFFSLSVTLPGTHAGRSALTRGKPILFAPLFPAVFWVFDFWLGFFLWCCFLGVYHL